MARRKRRLRCRSGWADGTIREGRDHSTAGPNNRDVTGRQVLLTSTRVHRASIGSVTALWIAGQPLSVASMIGFVTLTGNPVPASL